MIPNFGFCASQPASLLFTLDMRTKIDCMDYITMHGNGGRAWERRKMVLDGVRMGLRVGRGWGDVALEPESCPVFYSA
jgi:hypothetical protein